ncbi:MAG TPA: serine hydrolase [Isosphaeraceae bacterium]|jgi:beta-lactamase class A|nr:serine hydrolase [Isosphaeraceae bacterium]
MKSLLILLVLAVVLDSSSSQAEDTIESRLMPLIRAHEGKVAVAVKHLEKGESFSYHEDDPMPTASLIKFPVMIEAYRQAAEKKIDLEKMLTLDKADQVQGSGILTQLSPGLTLSVRDAVRLMIALSDNTATNLVLDQIGIGSTAETMEKMGFPNTKIHAKVFRRDTSLFPERSKQFGLGSTTASEMVRLFDSLYKNELASRDACVAMIEHLKACDDKEKFPRFLPSGTKVAFKTGSLDEVRTAAGIIYSKGGPIALCVMTNHNEDHRWVPDNAGNRLCAEIAREVYEHFNPPETDAASNTDAAKKP